MKILPRWLPWALVLVGVLLGTYGFAQLPGRHTAMSNFYLAVQLIALNSGAVDGPVPWSLEIARWLAPVATVAGLIASFADELRTRYDMTRVRWMWRRHAIVCGTGNQTVAMVAALGSAHHKVIVVDLALDLPIRDQLRTADAVYAVGDIRQSLTQAAVRFQDAGKIVIMRDDDDDALLLAIDLAQVTRKSGHEVDIHVHLSSDHRAAVIEDPRMWLPGSPVRRIRTFNRYRNAARALLSRIPMELQRTADGQDIPAAEVHLVVGALDRFTRAIILQAAAIGHFVDCPPLRVHLVGPTALADLATLQQDIPGLSACVHLSALHVVDAQWAAHVRDLIHEHPRSTAWTIMPGAEASADAFVQAFLFAGIKTPDFAGRVWTVVPQESNTITPGVADPTTLAERGLYPLTLDGWASDVDALFGYRLDQLARQIHEEWFSGQCAEVTKAEAAGDTERARRIRAKATFQPWADLSGEERAFNRSQADHVLIKLRAVAMRSGDLPLQAAAHLLQQSSTAEPAGLAASDRLAVPAALDLVEERWSRLTGPEIEQLAIVEHDRWCADHWLAGWVYGAGRDDLRRQHPDLVPYAQLSDLTKEYDRDAVRRVPHLLRMACAGALTQQQHRGS